MLHQHHTRAWRTSETVRKSLVSRSINEFHSDLPLWRALTWWIVFVQTLHFYITAPQECGQQLHWTRARRTTTWGLVVSLCCSETRLQIHFSKQQRCHYQVTWQLQVQVKAWRLHEGLAATTGWGQSHTAAETTKHSPGAQGLDGERSDQPSAQGGRERERRHPTHTINQRHVDRVPARTSSPTGMICTHGTMP